MTSSDVGLLAATAVHAGFQMTVTALTYPALARIAPAQWSEAHDAHMRAITPLVVLIYGGLAATGVWALLSEPAGWTWGALAAMAVAVLVTAVVAGPAHGGLRAGHDRPLIERLLRADRVRAAAAVIAVVAAYLATM